MSFSSLFSHKGERFAQDERILLAPSIDDIPSGRGLFHPIDGVLCPYNPFSPEERDDMIAFARRHVAAKGAHAITSLRALPPYLARAASELQNTFARATGLNRLPVLRINSSHPVIPHAHEVSLTCTFTGMGTIGINRRGEEYSAPLNHVFLFYKDISHKASAYTSPDFPKITLMV